jgi:hypothetical protein
MIHTENLKTCLRQLSDPDFQERTWTASRGPEISSFSELVSQTFDDTGLEDALSENQCPSELDARSFAELKALSAAVSEVDEFLPPEVLLYDPKLRRVRELAARALASLEGR